MSALRTLSLSLLVLAIGGSGAVAQNRGGFALPTEEGLNRIGLTRAWSGHAVSNTTRDKVLHVTLDDNDRLYVQTSNSMLTCFDAETGKRLWATRLGAADTYSYPPSFSGDLAFCAQGLMIYAIRKSSGDIAWELPLPSTPSTSPSSDDVRLYIGGVDGCLYAFDYRKITELTQKGMMPRYAYTALNWRYKTDKPITSAAISNGRLAAFASLNGSLYSVTTEDRELIFQFASSATVSAPVVRYRDWLLVASEDFNFYSVHIDNGRKGWQFPAGAPIRKAPVVIRDDVYIAPERAGLYRINAATGASLWWARTSEQFLAASPDKIYTRDRTNNLLVLARSDGATLKRMPMPSFPHMMVNEKNDRLYVSTQGGMLMCLHELGRPFPAMHNNTETRPLLPEFTPEPTAPGLPEVEPPAGEAPADAPPADAPAADAPADNAAPPAKPDAGM